MAFHHVLRVRFGECDMQGVVFFARYPEYFDLAMTELWRTEMGGWERMLELGADLVVAELNVRYRGSARFEDVLDVEAFVERLGETSVRFGFAITREDGGERLAEGALRYVAIDPATKAKRPIPGEVRSMLERHLAAEPAA